MTHSSFAIRYWQRGPDLPDVLQNPWHTSVTSNYKYVYIKTMTCETSACRLIKKKRSTRYKFKKYIFNLCVRFHVLRFVSGLRFSREKFAAPCASKISKASSAIKVIYIHFHRFQRVARIRGMIRPLNLRVGVKFTG